MAARAQATRQDILPQVDRLAKGALVAARRVSRRRGMSLLALAREVLYLSRRGWRLRFGLRLTPRPRGGVGLCGSAPYPGDHGNRDPVVTMWSVGIWLKSLASHPARLYAHCHFAPGVWRFSFGVVRNLALALRGLPRH